MTTHLLPEHPTASPAAADLLPPPWAITARELDQDGCWTGGRVPAPSRPRRRGYSEVGKGGMETSAGCELGVGAALLLDDASSAPAASFSPGLGFQGACSCFGRSNGRSLLLCWLIPDAVFPSTLVGRVAFHPGPGPGAGLSGPALWILFLKNLSKAVF